MPRPPDAMLSVVMFERLLGALLAASPLDPQILLAQLLDFVVAEVGAVRGYLAVGRDGDVPDAPSWWVARGFGTEAIDDIQAALSTGVLRAALQADTALLTSSAIADPRFSGFHSVQETQLESVLAAPLGSTHQGVLYLQGAQADEFTEEHRAFIAWLAALLRGPTDRVAASTVPPTDPTRAHRDGGRFAGIVGRSEALARVLSRAARFAEADAPVLITGETGTGKSALARAIHHASRRTDGPFVEAGLLNLPADLVDSELFGYERGAHSTAHERTVGRVARAAGGTLFLDEVGDLTPATQGKLLRFVESKMYAPLGGVEQQADVRVIAATNARIDDAARGGGFRADLLHRLGVLRLHLPPLRERLDDIVPIAESLGARHAASARRAWGGFADDAARWLVRQPWRGNIRELSNVVQRAIVLAPGDGPLDAHALEDAMLDGAPREAEASGSWSPGTTLDEAVDGCRRRVIERALSRADGNMAETARMLGISRQHLYDLVRELGIRRP